MVTTSTEVSVGMWLPTWGISWCMLAQTDEANDFHFFLDLLQKLCDCERALRRLIWRIAGE